MNLIHPTIYVLLILHAFDQKVHPIESYIQAYEIFIFPYKDLHSEIY